MLIKAPKTKIRKSSNIAQITREILKKEHEFDQDKEHFFVFGLNSDNSIRFIDITSIGTLNLANIHPRETFRMAIHKGVAAIIVAHNHPSGTAEPSELDKGMTNRLKEAGKIIGIEVLDHIIVTEKGHYSFESNHYKTIQEENELLTMC